MSSYSYKRKEWLIFRDKCLKNAENACERCKRTDVILQVHHPDYVSHLKLWEYPVEFCEVVCRGCHAQIHGKIKPSGGWKILCSDLDGNEPSDPISCENCGLEIRWHVTVHHPDWGEIIVGSECAETLSLGPEIKKLKSYQRRLQTFLVSPRWKPTRKGFRITHEGCSVLIFKNGDYYRLKIGEGWGDWDYRTVEEAKERAFDVVLSDSDTNR